MAESAHLEGILQEVEEPVGGSFSNPWELFPEDRRREVEDELRRMADVSRRAESDSGSLRVS